MHNALETFSISARMPKLLHGRADGKKLMMISICIFGRVREKRKKEAIEQYSNFSAIDTCALHDPAAHSSPTRDQIELS